MQESTDIYGTNFKLNLENKKSNFNKKSIQIGSNASHSDLKLHNSLLYNQAGASSYNYSIPNIASKNSNNFIQNLSEQKTTGSTNLQSSELTYLTNKLLRESDVFIEKKN